VELRQQPTDFVARQHHRQSCGLARADHPAQVPGIVPEDHPIQEQHGAQRLVLRGRAHAPVGGQRGEKGDDRVGAERHRVPLAVKQDEAAYPVQLRLRGARAQVAQAAGQADLIQKPGLGGWRRWGGRYGQRHARGGAMVVPARGVGVDTGIGAWW
jgi:hypothetical protein